MLNILILNSLLITSLVASTPLARTSSTTKTGLLGVDAQKKRLTFTDDGKFKVVSFSDLHYGERNGDGSWADWGPEQDVNTTRVQSTVLDNERPNFVIYNGDLVTGENLLADNATANLDLCYSATVARKIPFASSHGNHDNSWNITHQLEIDYESKHYGGCNGLSYTRSDVGPRPYGPGNYWIPVYAKTNDTVPAMVVWVFDSQSFVPGGSKKTIPKAAQNYWVDPQTVPAYVYSQGGLMNKTWGKIPPALVFVHIPLEKSEVLANLTGLIGDKDDDPNPAVQGYVNGTKYTGLDLPFFKSLSWLNQGRGNVLAVTSGHDHGDSWCARGKASNGLALCFNGHAGYGGYATPHSQVRNGRVFDINLKDILSQSPRVKTYNSYEDKSRNDFVTLDSSFYQN